MDILNVFKDLMSIKEEAIKKVESMIGLGYLELIEEECDKVIVRKITISPVLSVEDLEEGDTVMDMYLTFFIDDITSKQIEELNKHGKVSINTRCVDGSNVSEDLWCIQYDTLYAFELDEDNGISASFCHSGGII